MQPVISDQPYSYVPPYRGRFWSWAFRFYLRRFLKTRYRILDWSCEGLDQLRSSLSAGNGIILAPNHSRLSDPMVMGIINYETPVHLYSLASWHVFQQSWLENFVSRRLGAFSIYREGVDREALHAAIDIVAAAERPLIVFPEGVISGSNDCLLSLMDGMSFIGRAAAAKREKAGDLRPVVIHPVSLRYDVCDGWEASLHTAAEAIELTFGWTTQEHRPMIDRVRRLVEAHLALREVQHYGSSRSGCVVERTHQLIEDKLQPLEAEWISRPATGDIVARVKELRIAIIHDMVRKNLSQEEKERRWRHLSDAYYAQNLSLFPKGYLDDESSDRMPMRLAETIERVHENLFDNLKVAAPMTVRLTVGAALPVPSKRDRTEAVPAIQQAVRDVLSAEHPLASGVD